MTPQAIPHGLITQCGLYWQVSFFPNALQAFVHPTALCQQMNGWKT